MNKNDLKSIERIIIRLIELNIITKNKTADYFYDSLEMNILVEFVEEIKKDLKKISREIKEKYDLVEWKIIEKEEYYDEIFGESMKINKVWELSSTLYERLYHDLINILESESEEYFRSLCKNRQAKIRANK